jgi:ribosomal protein S18 acetylase RimI-like enzyme
MDIAYSDDQPVDTDQFIALLNASGLAASRPIADRACVASMVLNADILITAWHGDELVGISRAVTDFTWCCHLSDIAVDAAWQRRGIGREMIARTCALLGDRCRLIVPADEGAGDYFAAAGFNPMGSVWVRAAAPPA